MLEPIWKEISKRSYYNALHKYGFNSDDFTNDDILNGNAYDFKQKYGKRPIYKKNCGIMAMIDGSGIIGYKYFKKVGYKTLLIVSQELAEAFQKFGTRQ